MRLVKGFGFWTVLALAGLVVMFVTYNRGSGEIKPEETHFRVVLGSVMTVFDPQLLTAAEDDRVFRNVFDTPFLYDDENKLQESPWLESLDISEDGITYTFRIRQGMLWSDGEPFTARDVVFSLKRIISPATGSQYATMVSSFVKNAEEWAQGQVSDEQLGIRQLDELTYQLILDRPYSFFKQVLTHTVYFPIPAHIVERYGSEWAHPSRIVSNGPYMIDSFVRGDRVVLKKNPYYPLFDEIEVDKITIFGVEDSTTAYNMFLNGEADLVFGKVPRDLLNEIRHHSTTHIVTLYGTYYYLLNVKEEGSPLGVPLVREALSLAIDRQELVDRVALSGVPAYSLIPPTSQYPSLQLLSFNPELGRKRLEEAGFPGGRDLPAITLLYNTDDLHKRVAEYLQQQWRKHLNIEVILENIEWKTLLERRRQFDYQLGRAGWFGDYYDPLTFLMLFRSDDPFNETGYNDPVYDALLESALSTTLEEQREQLFYAAEARLLEALPVLPLLYYEYPILLDDTVWKGYNLENPLNYAELRFLRRLS